MKQNDGEDMSDILHAYNQLFRPMKDLERPDLYNQHMIKGEMLITHRRMIISLLQDHILSSVCPLTFDLQLKNPPKIPEVAATFI